MMPTEIILVWLPSLLISIISLLIFIYLSFRNRQKIDDLKQQAHDLAQQRIEHFLQRETQATRQRIKLAGTSADTQSHAIDKLRLIWLEGELTALTDQGKRRSNYDLLLHAVQPIARQLNRPAPTSNTPLKQAAVAQLQKVRGALSSQTDSIAQYRQNIAATNRDSAQAQTAAGFDSALDNVEQNSADLLGTIARLERELAALQQKLSATEQQAQTALTRKAESSSSDILVISTPTQQGDKLGATRELLVATDQAYKQSVVEIGRMREINSQQRQLILQLEKELQLMRKDSAQYDLSSKMLDKLKLQLRDYETCTVILEDEADSLRDKLETLNKAITHDQENQAGATQEFTAPMLAAPTAMPPKNRSDILPLIAEIIGLQAPQQIAAKLTEWLRDKKLSAVVFMRGEAEQIWASSEGGVDTHSKQLLQSLVPVPEQPRFDVDEGILFAYPICSALIYQSSALHDDESQLILHLQLLLQIVDRWLAALQAKQIESTAIGTEDLHGQLNGLLAQYKYISTEHGRVGEKFQMELSHFFTSAELSDIQQRVVTTMMEDYSSQLDIIGKASKLIYTRLKSITQDLAWPDTLH
jgi:hypothetical protein